MVDSNREERDGAEAPMAATDRLMAADSVFSPRVSVIVTGVDGVDEIRETIGTVTEMLDEFGTSGEVIVSGHLSDEVVETARALGGIVLNQDSDGPGVALRAAFEQVRGDYVAVTYGQEGYDLMDLPRLFARLEGGADLVVGSRVEDESEAGMSSMGEQSLLDRILDRARGRVTAVGISDPMSGLQAMHRGTLGDFPVADGGREMPAEIVRHASAQGLRVEEIPVTYRGPDVEVAPKRTFLELVPADLFTASGLLAGAIGVVLMAATFLGLEFLTTGLIGGFGPRMMLAGSLLTVVGHLVVTIGIFVGTSASPTDRSDALTAWIIERFDLNAAVVLGSTVAGLGVVYAVFLLYRWLAFGYPPLVELSKDLLAMTAIVLGLQIMVGGMLVRSAR